MTAWGSTAAVRNHREFRSDDEALMRSRRVLAGGRVRVLHLQHDPLALRGAVALGDLAQRTVQLLHRLERRRQRQAERALGRSLRRSTKPLRNFTGPKLTRPRRWPRQPSAAPHAAAGNR